MIRRLKGLLPGRARAERPEDALAPPHPARRAYVVGDIHGRLDLLHLMLARISEHGQGESADLVFVGDYVDRGPDSAGVIALLRSLGNDVTCLMGNHERMMLDFLDDPLRNGPLWLANGGDETLASFSVHYHGGGDKATRLRAQADALRTAMPAGTEAWLRGLPLYWQSGTLIAVHALTNPALPMAEQHEETLLWARPGAKLRPRDDGAWVVHGHTVVPEPRSARGHVAIDTGAVRSGVLTAAVFDGQEPCFLQCRNAL